MPIYEYYCPTCDARFQHLVRSFDAAPPPCPACGNPHVEKVISRVHLGRSEAALRESFDAQARALRDGDADAQTAARFLQEGGALLDEVAPPTLDREIFREIMTRRAEGAQENDFADVTAAIPLPPLPEGLASHAHGHEHDHEHEDDPGHEHPERPSHPHRRARDLGWG